MAQQTRAAFWAVADDPTRLVPSTAMLARQEFMDEINDTLGQFADGTDPDVVGNASKVLYTIRNFYDILVSSPAPTLCP
jgi:hypothetical protein